MTFNYSLNGIIGFSWVLSSLTWHTATVHKVALLFWNLLHDFRVRIVQWGTHFSSPATTSQAGPLLLDACTASGFSWQRTSQWATCCWGFLPLCVGWVSTGGLDSPHGGCATPAPLTGRGQGRDRPAHWVGSGSCNCLGLNFFSFFSFSFLLDFF